MFAELQPLLDQRNFVIIVAPLDGGRIQVQFIPKATKDATEQDKPILQPLTLSGTAAELDAGMAEAVSNYSAAYTSIAEQVAATKKAMADAKAAEEAKRKAEADAKKNKKTVPPAKAASPAKPEEKKADTAPSLFNTPTTTETTASQDENETEEEEVFEP